LLRARGAAGAELGEAVLAGVAGAAEHDERGARVDDAGALGVIAGVVRD
jgi:hypothetical protein